MTLVSFYFFLKFSKRAKYGVSFSYASKDIANAIGFATNEFLNVCPFDYTAVAGVGRWARKPG